MKRIKIGNLDVALLDAGPGDRPWTLLVDWRMFDRGNRWRLSVGPRLHIMFSERYGYTAKAKRARFLGLDFAWYGKGVE